MMTNYDDYYRGVVQMSASQALFLVSALTRKGAKGRRWEHSTWLHLMGLIETWDLKSND